jgi:hypothetical protein
MSQSAELTTSENSVATETAEDDACYSDPDLPPVLSQRRPAARTHSHTQARSRDEAPDTIPAPMWFVEE